MKYQLIHTEQECDPIHCADPDCHLAHGEMWHIPGIGDFEDGEYAAKLCEALNHTPAFLPLRADLQALVDLAPPDIKERINEAQKKDEHEASVAKAGSLH